MESNYSKSDSIQLMTIQFVKSDQEGRKQILDELSDDSLKLIALFKNVTNPDTEYYVKDSDAISSIFEKIEILDSQGQLDENQVKNIIKIGGTIFPSTKESLANDTLKASSINFLKKHIDEVNTENVYDYLKYAKGMNDHEDIQKCLEVIQHETGVKFVDTGTFLTIEISNPKVSYEELSKTIAAFSEVYKGKIEIKFSPMGKTILSAKPLFENHGHLIHSLNIEDTYQFEFNDSNIDNLIGFCPNLVNITIKSMGITGTSLLELSNLKKLTTLDLSDCNLVELPNPLPASLRTLSLEINTIILPDPLPENLSELNIFQCDNLTLPSSFPSSLRNLSLTWCSNLKELTNLPLALSELNLRGCSNLSLPDSFPPHLNKLNLSSHSKLKELPTLPPRISELDLEYCQVLEKLKSPLPPNLRVLNLSGCRSIELNEDLPETLNELDLSYCPNLKKLPNNLPPNLEKLKLSKCSNLELPSSFPPHLSVLDLSGCKKIVELKNALPTTLTELNLSRCENLKKLLSDLPPNLKTLYLSECKELEELPSSFPESLLELDFSGCKSLVELKSALPSNLKVLNLSQCANLQHLTSSLPPHLTELNFTKCASLEEVTTSLPANLSVLNFWGCDHLKKLPIPLPANLSTLDLSECTALNDNARLSGLSSLLDVDFDNGINLIKKFEINDKEALWKLITEKLNGSPLLQGEDYQVVLAEALNKKMSDGTLSQATLVNLSQMIFDQDAELGLLEEHPLMQQVVTIMALSSLPEQQNPFSIFKKLKELSEVPSNFRPPPMELEGNQVFINMAQLEALSQGSSVTRDDLPQNVTLESFNQLTNALKDKVEKNPDLANDALKALHEDIDWTTINYPIFTDPKQQLVNYLKQAGKKVSETEAKWRAVLSNVLDKNNNLEDSKFFTEREEVFILTMMGIQNCEGGKAAGIAASYDLLSPQYKYKINLSKPMGPMEQQEHKERLEGIDIIKKFVAENPKITRENRSHALTKYVNDNLGTVLGKINRLITDEDTQYDMDDGFNVTLNEKGAKDLLTLVEKEAQKPAVNEFLSQTIQRLMAAQFTGTNDMVEVLSGMPKNQISQGAHYSIYLKNLIGQQVGVSREVVFDNYTGALNDQFVNKERDEVLKVFFQYITPQSFVDEVVNAVNENPVENKKLLSAYLGDEFWSGDSPPKLNPQGALILLKEFEFLS